MKEPVWRAAETDDKWFPVPYVWARVNGWKLDVFEVTKGWDRTTPTGVYYFHGENKKTGEFFNSAWPENNRYWKTQAAAQAAAVKGAREGWDFLKRKP